MAYPKIFDQLSAGWVDNIVITHCSQAPSVDVNRLRYRIDRVNSSAESFYLKNVAFEGRITPLLNVTDFETTYKKQFRDRCFPDIFSSSCKKNRSRYAYAGPAPQNVCTMCFEIDAEVDRKRFLAFMNALNPGAVFKSLGPMDDLASASQQVKDKNLKGLRFAQALAKEKVENSNATIDQDEVQKLAQGSCDAMW